MAKPENIIPHKFKKGQSGNPKGRPKKLPGLDELITEVLGDGDAMERVLRKLLSMAEKGNLRAIEMILDRAYGKAKQEVAIKSFEDMVNGRPLADWTDDEIMEALKQYEEDDLYEIEEAKRVKMIG